MTTGHREAKTTRSRTGQKLSKLSWCSALASWPIPTEGQHAARYTPLYSLTTLGFRQSLVDEERIKQTKLRNEIARAGNIDQVRKVLPEAKGERERERSTRHYHQNKKKKEKEIRRKKRNKEEIYCITSHELQQHSLHHGDQSFYEHETKVSSPLTQRRRAEDDGFDDWVGTWTLGQASILTLGQASIENPTCQQSPAQGLALSADSKIFRAQTVHTSTSC